MAVDLRNLKARAGVLRTIRAFFDARGFVEGETPVRIPAPAPEPHIDCPASGDWFLRASPELQMKKLLAAGLPRICQIGPCFREGERGRRHAPDGEVHPAMRGGGRRPFREEYLI
jgi:lysyl-tRNA synthetase class 2